MEWAGGDGDPVKKKRIESLRPVSFRNIPIIELKAKAGTENTSTKTEAISNTGAKLIMETQIRRPEPLTPAPLSSSQPKADSGEILTEVKAERPTMGALHKIRQQMASKNQSGKDMAVPLSETSLAEAWNLYINKLTALKNHSTAANLKLAECVITGEHSFDIFTDTIIQQRFVEQERGGLIDHLHQFFNNRQIIYQVMVKAPTEDTGPVEKPLNKREQFLKMVEEYPLVKALKDNLNLELE
jgi:DNA polymerase-3 subunit gamma/tau